MTNYFESKAIGSSILGQAIVSFNPLEINTDLITEVAPTTAMELGKQFEDLIQSEHDENLCYWEKYFRSQLNKFPTSTSKKYRSILEIMDLPKDEIPQAIENAFVWNVNPDKHGNKVLNGQQKKRHDCLIEIQNNQFRSPIMKKTWSLLETMRGRFYNAPFACQFGKRSIGNWMSIEQNDVRFQAEHYWNNGVADCRAKFDMIWIMKNELDGKMYGIPFDLKVTGDSVNGLSSFGVFARNWRPKYIWQAIHYWSGFNDWCEQNGIIPLGDGVEYLIQEGVEPFLTHTWKLSMEDYYELEPTWLEACAEIQQWIDAGKPFKGYTEQRIVNRYGKRI